MLSLLLLLLLRWAPRALGGGPSGRQHLLGVGREDSEWGRRTTKGVLPEDIEVSHFCSQCSSVCNRQSKQPKGSVSPTGQGEGVVVNSGRHGVAIALSNAARPVLLAWVPISFRLASARMEGAVVVLIN